MTVRLDGKTRFYAMNVNRAVIRQDPDKVTVFSRRLINNYIVKCKCRAIPAGLLAVDGLKPVVLLEM